MNNNVVDFSYVKSAIAYEIDKRNWQSVNHIPGIHDNGPRDQGLWRPTLTAYWGIKTISLDLQLLYTPYISRV